MANEIVNKTFTYVWKIVNCSQSALNEGCTGVRSQILCSPVFTHKCLEGGQWSLHLDLRIGYHNEFAVSLFRQPDGNIRDILVDYKMVINIGSKMVTNFKGQHLFSQEVTQTQSRKIYVETNNAMDKWTDTLSVSCAITTNNPIGNEATGCEARTKIGENRFSFVWNTEVIASDWTQSIKCPYPDLCPIEITLTAPQENIVTGIRMLTNVKNDQLIRGRIALLDMVGFERYATSRIFLFKRVLTNDENVRKFPYFIKKSQLKKEKDIFVKNGVISLMCCFTIANRIESMEIVKYVYDIPVDSNDSRVDIFSTLQNDLTAMFNNQDHSDVKLKIGSEEFPAHKIILATRSPVFSAMLKRNMVESQTGVVDISDIDAGTLKSFLEFLYTDKVNELEYESASNLLIVADKYQVVSLKEKCSFFLMSVLSVGNVCNVLRMADMVGHELLKYSAMDFIKEHSGTILSSSEWCELINSNCRLASEVLHKFSAILEKTTLQYASTYKLL